MRNIRDVLRLKAAGMSKRKIAASLDIGATAAGECLRRAREAGVGWPLPDGMTDAVRRISSRVGTSATCHRRRS
jgi:transposase